MRKVYVTVKREHKIVLYLDDSADANQIIPGISAEVDFDEDAYDAGLDHVETIGGTLDYEITDSK